MENNELQVATAQNYQLEFKGQGSAFFGILIVNWILTVLTLGFYYPWARAKQLQYIYSHTTLNNESFYFSGTGAEIFKGFIKLFIRYLLFIGVIFIFSYIFAYLDPDNNQDSSENSNVFAPIGISFLIFLLIIVFIPMIIHGSLRYRMSRTSYRGIRFGYRGAPRELMKQFVRDILLTIVTLGIYNAWFSMNLRSYTHRHIRYGNVEFSNEARGGEYFILYLKGYFLTFLTLGIYSFWFQKDIFNYYIDKMELKQGENRIKMHSTATGGAFFKLNITNFLLLIFTFGIASAWVEMRTLRFIFSHIQMTGNIDLSAVSQTEIEYNDAFGENIVNFLNFD
jgi:uncharacterized membrane protein YjgN (DUF898 family)